MGFIVCIKRIGRYMEGKYNEGLGKWKLGIYNSRRLSH